MKSFSIPFMDGWLAHRAQVPVERNPHDDFVSPFSHREWEAGWVARFQALKHGFDMSLDDA